MELTENPSLHPSAIVVELAPHAGLSRRPTTGARVLQIRKLLPLWRHGVWLGALFVVLACAVAVRLDVQQMRKDLDRNTRAQREALILNERLQLEVDSRRRAVAMEAVAAQLAMTTEARIVSVKAPE